VRTYSTHTYTARLFHVFVLRMCFHAFVHVIRTRAKSSPNGRFVPDRPYIGYARTHAVEISENETEFPRVPEPKSRFRIRTFGPVVIADGEKSKNNWNDHRGEIIINYRSGGSSSSLLFLLFENDDQSIAPEKTVATTVVRGSPRFERRAFK